MIVLLLAGCPKSEPVQQPQPVTEQPRSDAAVIDAAPDPIQTPPANTSIRASSYAQNCTRDDECVAVFEGDACMACQCAFNAIHVAAFPKYKADINQFWACRKQDECKTTCAQKIGDPAKCDAGTCILPP